MPVDEFETIAKLFRPLTRDAPEALDLKDDAACLPSHPDYDLVMTKDAMVEGVHFLPDDPLDLVARKLLRVNLSDLAAKGAEPFAYMLAVGWSERCGWPEREAFARGLAEDGEAYDLSLYGGDTTSTPGPMWASITAYGWVPECRIVTRSGARPGDLLVVTGDVGRGRLGLLAARGEIDAPELARHYRLPTPRLDLSAALVEHAHAAADISDGLLADAVHLAQASGCAVRIELEKAPLPSEAEGWLKTQSDSEAALLSLAAGGDDYEIVCAIAPQDLDAFAAAAGSSVTVVGAFEAGEGLSVSLRGKALSAERTGWRHG